MGNYECWVCGWTTPDGKQHVQVFDCKHQADNKAYDLKDLGIKAVIWNMCGG